MKRILLILFIVLAGFSNYFFPKPLPTKPTEITREATSTATLTATASAAARVSRVIDGDTVELEGGQRVRYIGIDAPESVDPRRPVMCFGREASDENKTLVEGKVVRLDKDISETDKYGRLLRYVYVGDIFVNDYMVRMGYANASTYPPDVRFAHEFTAAQDEARTLGRGLWKGCSL